MNKNPLDFLSKHSNGATVKYIGNGTDSVAYRVGEYVYRFPRDEDVAAQYEREATICDHVRDAITAEIPKIDVCRESGFVFARHKMIMGKKWRWRTFKFHPIKQRNLANGLALFFAELHGCKFPQSFQKKISADNFKQIEIGDILPRIEPFLAKWQLRLIEKKYNQIRNTPVEKSNMVLCHMGIKGGNSVVDENGNLTGVFDFGNSGIHERWLDFVPVFTSHNARLYKMVMRRYSKYTGIKSNYRRIYDLASIERFVYKRWFNPDGTFADIPERRIKRSLAYMLILFLHIPRVLRHLFYLDMTMRAYFRRRKN